MDFYCNICEKKYKTKQTLNRHNNIRHPKDKNIPKVYNCNKCNEQFEKYRNKYYHQKNCTKELAIIPTENNEIIIPVENNNIALPAENKLLTNTENNVIKSSTINSSQINSNNVNNNVNIVINNYNNDNLDYVSEAFKDRLFKHLINDDEHVQPLSKLLENIKFNPKHKENNNVKITSDRSKIGFYYDKKKWHAINKDQLLNELCDYSLKIFKKYFEEKKDKLPREIKNQYNVFQVRLKTEFKKKIKKKIENIAYIFSKNNDYDLDD